LNALLSTPVIASVSEAIQCRRAEGWIASPAARNDDFIGPATMTLSLAMANSRFNSIYRLP
jgi:hypothetical protein